MAPTTEQLILVELQSIRAEQTKQGKELAAIKAIINEDKRSCSECKQTIDKNLNILYERVRAVELQEAQDKGADAAEEKAEAITWDSI